MSTFWLRGKLATGGNAKNDDGDPVLTIYFEDGGSVKIYCPSSDEYRITADVVEKASELGANMITYGSWCDVTVEGKMHAKAKGISVVRYGGLFAFLRGKGVSMTE